MNMEEYSSKKSFLSLTKTQLIIIGLVLAAIFVGSILATYYGKPDSCKDNDLLGKCEKLACDNRTIISSKLIIRIFYELY